jgi:8-oxo-dGTP pyrophosphatase MutT (NUDIX family)
MSSRLNSVTAEWKEKHDWILEVDGEKVPFSHLKVSTEKFGVGFEVGLRPEGFPGPAFYEKGGVITILYSFTDAGELLIGLLEKKRPNLSNQPIFEAVGGLVDPGEKADQAQARELREESGINLRAEAIPGMVAWNRLYQFADLDKEEGGVKRYIVRIPFSYLRQQEEGYVFSREAVDEHGLNEDVRFLNWEDACFTPDAIAASGICALLAALRKRNRTF